MISKRQFTGTPFGGIIFQKAQRVSAPDRGISFERPDRYVLNTPVGQLEIYPGDWVVEYNEGRPYIIRAVDFNGTYIFKRKWWKLW